MRGCAEEFYLPRLLASPTHVIGNFGREVDKSPLTRLYEKE